MALYTRSPQAPGATREVAPLRRRVFLETLGNSLFILPALVLFALFSLYPLVRTVALSVTEWNGLSPTVKFVGAANFVAAFQDAVFWRGMFNALLFALVALTVMNGLGLLLALLVDNPRIKGAGFYRSIYYIPPIMSPAVVAVLWKWIYHPYSGTLNKLLRAVGLDSMAKAWLSLPETALWAVSAATVWQGVGSPFLLYLAGLQSIPTDVREAAVIDGANSRQALFYVTLPLLAPVAVRVSILTILGAFQLFAVILIMTGGGPGYATEVPMLTIYREAFDYQRFGYSTALSLILGVLLLLLSFVQTRLAARFGGGD